MEAWVDLNREVGKTRVGSRAHRTGWTERVNGGNQGATRQSEMNHRNPVREGQRRGENNRIELLSLQTLQASRSTSNRARSHADM